MIPETHRHRGEDSFKIDLKEISSEEVVKWTELRTGSNDTIF
jgi:hypothetical protein